MADDTDTLTPQTDTRCPGCGVEEGEEHLPSCPVLTGGTEPDEDPPLDEIEELDFDEDDFDFEDTLDDEDDDGDDIPADFTLD